MKIPLSRLPLLALLFAAGHLPSRAAPPPPPEEIQKTLTAFFNLLKEDKLDAAYDLILAGTKIKAIDEEKKQLKTRTREAIVKYGAILGYEIIEQKRVGVSLMQITCLSWSDESPLRWRFTYYRPGDKWRLVDILVDGKIGDLFDPRPSTGGAGAQD